MKKRLTGLVAVIVVLMLVFSMGAAAAECNPSGENWDADAVDTYAFGWNIARVFAPTPDLTGQGQPIPFFYEGVYDAVADSVSVYLGQLEEGKALTVANVKEAESAGTLTKLNIGGFFYDSETAPGVLSFPSYDNNPGLTVGDVKEKGLIVVADKGLAFNATSVCCNNLFGYNCNAARFGAAGDFNESTQNGTAKIMNITPAMLSAEGIFHPGIGCGYWLMLSLGCEQNDYAVIYKVWNDVDKEFKVDHCVFVEEGAEIPDYTPEREGAEFSGWKTDETLAADWEKPAAMPAEDIVVYGEFTSILNKNDHVNYIMGYPDGTVNPLGSITRGEISSIFFRLLTEEERNAAFTDENDFTDVQDPDMWYHNPVSTLAKEGLLHGYEAADGTFVFAPEKAITRAELATIIALFTEPGDLAVELSDIEGHWAEDFILKAVSNGWLHGYDDGTFRPDALVNRAEAVTMVNHALGRVPASADAFVDGMAAFSDCTPVDENGNSVWYYTAIQEAANNHTYQMTEESGEQWLEVLPAVDWTEWEKALTK